MLIIFYTFDNFFFLYTINKSLRFSLLFLSFSVAFSVVDEDTREVIINYTNSHIGTQVATKSKSVAPPTVPQDISSYFRT